MWYEVLKSPFPKELGLPEDCILALVCEEEEGCPLVIGSAAHTAESLDRHRVWFETWARILNNKSVHWSDKARCLEVIEKIREAARQRRQDAEAEPVVTCAESQRRAA